MRRMALVLAVVLAGSCGAREETAVKFDPEAHMFLEEVEGKDALDWVKKENARSLAVLEGDARYQGYYDAALKMATSKERIPYASIRSGYAYNFWQDEDHERGIWRRVKLARYASESPPWETLLDVDALAKAENANWVYKGVDCRPPEYADCLVELSDGGKDAVRIREYDIAMGGAQKPGKPGFVGGGFDVPEAKTSIEWQDKDTVLIATDWGEGTLTESGYPFVVKRLKRGQKLDQAVEVFRGAKENVATSPFVIEEASGKRYFGAVRADTFFTSSYFYFPETGSAPLKLPIPPKSTLQGVFADTLLLSLEEDWQPEGQETFKTGDLVGFQWSSFMSDGKLPKVELVLRPTARQAIQGVGIAKGAVLLNISDNVVMKVFAYTRSNSASGGGGSGWSAKEIAMPPNGSAGIAFSDTTEGTAMIGYAGYLTPDSLFQYDSSTGAIKPVKALPPRFDALPYQVDQQEATSKDGTKIPYFVVRRKDLKYDSSNPTLVYGYGGFQVSETPAYSGTVGKLWLDQGGVYVMANIRGGGEFGPAWHQAGLKTKRQVVYDDFIAVAEDLIASKITSKPKLAAMGGSNGGLLMGVMFTQRPDLFHAIVCQVPLLDMLRYKHLLAGASWMDEYGDPDVPEERAFLEKLSPYHNVDPNKTYPEIYFETSTKDDRVHPGHARKMAKRLEELGKPFLYYENTDGGHSAAANQREVAHRVALEYTYLARKLIDGK